MATDTKQKEKINCTNRTLVSRFFCFEKTRFKSNLPIQGDPNQKLWLCLNNYASQTMSCKDENGFEELQTFFQFSNFSFFLQFPKKKSATPETPFAFTYIVWWVKYAYFKSSSHLELQLLIWVTLYFFLSELYNQFSL